MVFKIVTSPSQGNLFNPGDFFGVGNDILHLMIPTPNDTAIRTYQGNDVVAVLSPVSGSTGYRFYLGTGNDTLLGSNVDDKYYDEGGHDQINMGDGSDTVFAGPGNDTIDGGSNTSGGGEINGDTIHFGVAYDMFGNGTVVTQGVTLDLASTTAQALGFYGNDTFLNFENVVGGVGNDHFSGTNAANLLSGGSGGADFLRGFGGDDMLLGWSGADILIGDGGADLLYLGRSGPDVQVDSAPDVAKYIRISDSTDENMDEIFNFQNIAAGGAGYDKIDLSSIDANPSLAGDQAFKFVGSAGFSSPGGEVRLAQFDGATLVMVDNDGDSTAEMVILIHGSTGLVAGDFIL